MRLRIILTMLLQGFWKNWHASFNLWLVRYLYIPLGGTHRRALAVWPIFTFVAVWHDLEWRLLAWAWLSCLLFAPELVRCLLVVPQSPRHAYSWIMLVFNHASQLLAIEALAASRAETHPLPMVDAVQTCLSYHRNTHTV
jgi:D-alanyl-lipoteichoic acid acyltransferase DltB (MBOAT superfamily)